MNFPNSTPISITQDQSSSLSPRSAMNEIHRKKNEIARQIPYKASEDEQMRKLRNQLEHKLTLFIKENRGINDDRGKVSVSRKLRISRDGKKMKMPRRRKSTISSKRRRIRVSDQTPRLQFRKKRARDWGILYQRAFLQHFTLLGTILFASQTAM